MPCSPKTFTTTVRLPWTVSEILPTSAVVSIKWVLHGNDIVKYLQNDKCHEADQGHSRKVI